MSALPSELRAACDKFHRGCKEDCVYHRAATEIEHLSARVDYYEPWNNLVDVVLPRMSSIFKHGYVMGERHAFVDDGTGLCGYEFLDDIGEGLTRHVGCGLMKCQPEHEVED